MPPSHHTPCGEFRHEIPRIKNSRFVASVAHASSTQTAREFAEKVSAELSDARHHCWAYRLGPGGREYRFSDDGEPGGSAGRPILAQIEGHAVSDAVVVVTRWFGGVKLGVGGLMRAYGGAAGAALDHAPLRVVTPMCKFAARFPYEHGRAIQALLSARSVSPIDSDYGAEVRMVFEVPEQEAGEFCSALRDRTAGRVVIEELPL
ncbi:MAG: YigZ family protein [Myxococcota bacterium]|nr:YigZ family protein [Myxococcota bacterium]